MTAAKGAKKRLARGFNQQRQKEALDKQSKTARELKIGYWNANGLVGEDKKDSLVELMAEHGLNLMCMAETHLKAGNHEDLSMFRDFKTVIMKGGTDTRIVESY